MSPFWVTAFLDNAAAHHHESVGFWQDVTGYAISAPRGDDGEFATLLPPNGDAYLRVQRRHQGGDRIHLDLHVPDPQAAARSAVAAGATLVVDRGYVVMASPGGFVFCFVPSPASVRPRATEHGRGSASRVRQVALDVPPAAYRTELGFWTALTGWAQRASSVSDDFRFLVPPADHDQNRDQPLRLLLQRLGEADASGAVRAHLDWGTTDRAAETERHLGLGAHVLAVHPHWTVLRDPVGRVYCLTDGDPT
ncbi:VOC family protein [Pimelobacter simplex]|uniref:VOC family protein n=1 Tax=Nocardioides simplex TaxID=2045 RepID=UPI0027E22DFC|nr:VOC family protein [Pimelobacter simplex]